MHNAPPVVFPVGRFIWGPRLALAMAALVSCALLCWLVWTPSSASLCVWAVCIWLVALSGTAWWLPREFLQEGELAWDGEAWHGSSPVAAEDPVHLSLTLDGGHFMLVSLRSMAQPGPGAEVRHAWVRRADMPSRWHGFRCAVYSRRTAVERTA
ncbi:MAG: hypothetical protein ACKOXU_10810 [Limnohabitans sp.]